MVCYILFFKQKTAYEMRISDWSSDVCSSDLDDHAELHLLPSARRREQGSLRSRRQGRIGQLSINATSAYQGVESMAASGARNHDYHLSASRPWQVLGAIGAFSRALGLVDGFHGHGSLWYVPGRLIVPYTLLSSSDESGA